MASKPYILRQEQWIPRPVDQVFAFFANARNLEALTPPWLGFEILSTSSEAICKGTEIRYRLRVHGIPIHWRTVIHSWIPPHRFTDVQASGPYRLWHHTHIFEAHGDRTRMIDVVRYQLPFGILGRIVHALMVRSDVRKIFAFRRQRIEQWFASQRGGAR